jgi:hypothetical protein
MCLRVESTFRQALDRAREGEFSGYPRERQAIRPAKTRFGEKICRFHRACAERPIVTAGAEESVAPDLIKFPKN